ncbi:MAG: hydroxymethylglutaryl-CoA reductase [bacterium]
MSIKLHQFENKETRAKFVSESLNVDLSKIQAAFVDDDQLQNVHCENLIGATSVPLGLAGPLVLSTENFENKDFYIPLATSEGALVASVSRGIKTINESGGGFSLATKVGSTRGPVFVTKNILESKKLVDWLVENFNDVKQVAESTSNHLKLLSLKPRILNNRVFVRFVYDADKAMGMNMATIATQKIVDFVAEKLDIHCDAVSGNYCVDKKPSWLNFIEGRGWEVNSEVVLSPDVVTSVLKTTPQKIFETWLSKCMLGSAMSGSMGFNCQFANIVAALFLATGQDLGQIVEGSTGITTVKILDNGDLYVGVFMPSVMLATIGGGTKLHTQNAALKIVNVDHPSGLAEVLGGAVLAGEISLLASLSVGGLAGSHQKLGR